MYLPEMVEKRRAEVNFVYWLPQMMNLPKKK
jgi:hypothetical protein